VTIQAVNASSQEKKSPVDCSIVSNVSSFTSVKRQLTKEHDYDSTLDSDEETNIANIMMSRYFQDVIASAAETALLNRFNNKISEKEFYGHPYCSFLHRKGDDLPLPFSWWELPIFPFQWWEIPFLPFPFSSGNPPFLPLLYLFVSQCYAYHAIFAPK